MTSEPGTNPIGVGKGHVLSEEMKEEIYQMYYGPGPKYGMRSIAHHLGIGFSTVRRHVYRMRDEGWK
tara:strand:- start:371 stop:571 length:201 start_codon:yes stop_codon:yes gene_type:complete